MKKYKIIIRCYKVVELYAEAPNKKEAKRMARETMDKTNIVDMLEPLKENYVMTASEELQNEK